MTEPPSNELPGNEDALRDRLQGLLRGLASKRMVHHAIVAIERVDGSFRWAGSIGPATPGGPPMRADTPYFLASITKLHIATVVMKLSETGLIDLDEPMTAYAGGVDPGAARDRRGGPDGLDQRPEPARSHLWVT
jgi:CubicO group peptidase (beta-lactamase class C family)